MSAQIPPEFCHPSQPPLDASPVSDRQKDKLLPPAALETQPSRCNPRRSSLGDFVSRILPSRRAEKGHTLRNEYEEGGPISAADLVFGVIEPPELQVPQGLTHNEGSKDIQGTSGSILGVSQVQSHQSATHDNGVESGVEQVIHKLPEMEGVWQEIHDGKSKGKNPERLISLKTSPGHGERELSQGHMTSQQKQPPFPLPTFNFQDDPLGLNFQEPIPNNNEEADMSKTQQMYRAKKARREQRRSLLESGDFLGVQGANPRTGYWDTSTATSSSDPSQLSYETRKKLEQQAKVVEEQKTIYEKAQSKYKTGLERANTLKAKRESEKIEQKRLQTRLKQRRRGRWNRGDNGWSSVAEPELSPIGQSLVGTPTQG